jgi:hypothetical protein
MVTQGSEGKPTDPPAASPTRPEHPRPRPYTPPVLRRLGSVRDLTLGNSSVGGEGGKVKKHM